MANNVVISVAASLLKFLFKLQPSECSKAGWRTGAAWPTTADDCKIKDEHCIVCGETTIYEA